MSQSTLLLLLLLWPFAAALIAFITPMASRRSSKLLALGLSLVPLLILLIGHTHWIGTQLKLAWIPTLSIEFYARIDSLSLLFLYLTAIFVPISLTTASSQQLFAPNLFYGLVLLLQGFLIAFFTARDLALFTIFWEAMLLPIYFIINLWGGPGRQSASLKFLIYTLTGSAFFIAAVFSLYFQSVHATGTGTFNLDTLAATLSSAPLPWVGAIFLLAFAVKTPLFPFHAWLPDAYYQAPTSGTILLASLLSKAGIYGILRIGMEIFPSLIEAWSPWLLGLAIAGTLYGACAAWMQTDFKRLIAYSSLSHVNFILAGLFVWNATSQSGALLQAVNHSISIAALFLVASWLEGRLGSTEISHTGGLAKYFPRLCWITLFFAMASVALPGTNNFVGELLIFFGLFGYNPWLAATLGLSVILSAIYMLTWLQKSYFGHPIPQQDSWSDITSRELTIAIPLIAIILVIGIYPAPLLNYVQSSIKTSTIATLEKLQ